MTLESNRDRSSYRFGRFCLHPATRALWRDGIPQALAPKVFDGLAYLIAHRDRAVGRDELTGAVWGRSDVSDVQLRQLLRKIRRAVDDDGERQAVIRTIAHFGFHWIGPVAEEAAGEVGIEPAQQSAALPRFPPPPPALARHRAAQARPRVRAGVWLAGLGIAVAGAAIVYGVGRERAPNADTVRPSAAGVQGPAPVGVLPTELTADTGADTGWMRLGLMDLIAGRLRQAHLPVVASSDVVALSGSGGTDLTARVRAATGAGAVLTSSASRHGGDWAIRLTWHEIDGLEHSVDAASPDPVLAADEAADRLLAALGRSSAEGPGEAAAASAGLLLGRVDAALLTGDVAMARRLIETAAGSVRGLAPVQLRLAQVEIETDQDEVARARLERLLQELPAESEPVLRARALTALAHVDVLDAAKAEAKASEAIDLLDRFDEPAHLAIAYRIRGIVRGVAGRIGPARDDFAQARVMYGLAHDTLGAAQIDNNEAVLDSRRGRVAAALPLFERAARIQEAFGAIDRLLTSVTNQVTANLALLRPARALAVYERSRPLLARSQSAQALRHLDYLGARSLAANGRLADARRLLVQVTGAADPAGEADLSGLADAVLAELDLADGRFDAAIARAVAARDALAPPERFALERSDGWLILTRAQRAAGRASDARAELQRLVAWASGQDDPAVFLRVRMAEAEQAWSDGDRNKARHLYESMIAAAERDGTPLDVRDVVGSYATALLGAGERIRAGSLIGRVARWAESDFECALLQVRLYRALGQQDSWQAALRAARALAGERAIPPSDQRPIGNGVAVAQAR